MPCFPHELLLQHSSAQNGLQLSENQVQPCNMKGTQLHKLVNSSTHEARVSKNGTLSLFGRNIIVFLYLCKYNATTTKIVSTAFDLNSTQISRITIQPLHKTLHNSFKIHFKTRTNTHTKQQLKLVMR
jgi:hypothetical protein